jgi:hypothetical protein
MSAYAYDENIDRTSRLVDFLSHALYEGITISVTAGNAIFSSTCRRSSEYKSPATSTRHADYSTAVNTISVGLANNFIYFPATPLLTLAVTWLWYTPHMGGGGTCSVRHGSSEYWMTIQHL